MNLFPTFSKVRGWAKHGYMDDDTSGLAPPLDVDLTRRLNFHGNTYVISVRLRRREAGEEVLCIDAEQEHSEERWSGEFTRQYVEEITTKTGNFKKFGVFVRMLLSALQQRSDSVFVDLLTYADLELLRARKTGQNPVTSSAPRNNKRYLILTYAVEFDRVHYPLPLLYDENPGPDALKRTIKRLNDEIASLQKTDAALNGNGAVGGSGVSIDGQQQHRKEVSALQKENAELRAALRKQTEDTGHAKAKVVPAVVTKLKHENGAMRQELHELQESYEELRESSAQEIRKLRRESKDLLERLRDMEEVVARQKKAPSLSAEREAAHRRQIVDLEAVADRERAAMHRLQAKHKKEMGELVKQLEKEVSAGKVLRSRNRDLQRRVAVLEAQVQAAKKAPKPTGRRTTPSASPCGSRPNSTVSSRFNSTANSRASSIASSRAHSRVASRTSSRDNSPRSAVVPRGRIDTSKVYGLYDNNGVNIKRATGRQPSPRYSPASSERMKRYVSPYTQSARPASNRRANGSGNGSGYVSGGSEGSARSRGSRASANSRRSTASAERPRRSAVAAPKARSPQESTPPRVRRPSPARSRGDHMHDADVLISRTVKSTSLSATGRSLALPDRLVQHKHVNGGAVGADNDHSPQSSTSRPRSLRSAWDEGDDTPESLLRGRTDGRRPLNGITHGGGYSIDDGGGGGGGSEHRGWAAARSTAAAGSLEPAGDLADGAVSSSPLSGRYLRRDHVNGDERSEDGPAAVEPPSPSGAGIKPGGDEYDATSEIGDIDRRLSALQTFLKNARNGVITRLPMASSPAAVTS